MGKSKRFTWVNWLKGKITFAPDASILEKLFSKKKKGQLVELVLWALYLLWQHCVFFLSLVVLPICGLNQKDNKQTSEKTEPVESPVCLKETFSCCSEIGSSCRVIQMSGGIQDLQVFMPACCVTLCPHGSHLENCQLVFRKAYCE